MRTRQLGRTGLDVSEIIFGCGNVGGLMIRAEDAIKRAAIRRSLDLGINWFDTAGSYGNGQSEVNLGRLLKEVNESPFVSTKVRLMPGDMSDIPAAIERNTRQSLERLQRQSVDLLQFHNHVANKNSRRAVAVDSVLEPGGVADALDDLREKGLTQFTGFTALGDVESCCQVIESGRFDAAQVYYNIINPTSANSYSGITTGQNFSGLIDSCKSNDVGVIVIRSVAAGVIASGDQTASPIIITQHTYAEEEIRKAHAVNDLLGEDYGTPAQTALRFILANPDISCIDIGPGEISHIEEAVAASDAGGLPVEALARLEGLYETGFDPY